MQTAPGATQPQGAFTLAVFAIWKRRSVC